MKAIILARVSNKKQDSNEAQVNRISEYVRRRELTVWKTYEIEESSTKSDRKKFQEIVKEIGRSKEPVALVVDTVDRLQRSFRESVQLDDLRKSSKLVIHFYRENLVLHRDSNSADLLRWDMAVMFARSYVLQLSDNVKRKLDEKRRNGELSGRAPVGYRNAGSERNGRDVVPDPLTAPLVRRMFELYATGNYSFLTLRNLITKEGLRSKSGKPLSISMVERILRNPFYYGEMVSKGVLFPHRHEILIRKSLYDKCQLVRTRWNKQPFKHAAKPFIFRGLLRCARCGCAMSPEIKKGRYVYYSCTTARKAICNKRTYVPEEYLLEPVYTILETLATLSQKTVDGIVDGLRQENVAQNAYHHTSVAALHQEHDSINQRIERLTDLLVEGTVTKEVYEMKLEDYRKRLREIAWELKEHTQADENYHVKVATVLKLAKNALALFKSSEVPEKRAILNMMLQNCTVDGKKPEFSMKSPYSTIYELAQQPTLLGDLDAFRNTNWKKALEDIEALSNNLSPPEDDTQSNLPAGAA